MDKRLFLIDGHALIFKMYYAFLRHPMINSKGVDTSILFGFTKYILELIEKEKPTHLAVSFDPPGGTFRHEMYPEYKGTREATPQLVIDALEPLTGLCRAMDIPVLMVKGYEADDVIGTVSKKAAEEGFTVYMVTPDKDYGQLVTDRILQYRPGKSGSESEILGPAEICSRYGISSPSQVIEILTICGDASDNVPGVKGVGEVGAGKLISRYGTVKEIYSHINELTPRQRDAFEAAREYLPLSHDLVTIKTDVPVEFSTAGMSLDTGFGAGAAELFDEYEFGSLKRYLGDCPAVHSGREEDFEYSEVTTPQACREAKKAGRFAILTDCDGTGIFSGIRRMTVGIVNEGQRLAASGTAEDFREILEDGNIDKTGYNLKKQLNILRNNGLDLKGRLLDIELMHYLINPEKSHRLDILAKSYLGISIDEPQSGQKESALSLFDQGETDEKDVPPLKEAAVTAMLGTEVRKEIDSLDIAPLYDTIEEPLIRVLGEMERTGVRIDLNQLRQYASGLSAELEQIQQRVREMAGEPDLNILSTKQIGYVIFEKLALDPKVKKAGNDKRYSYSTDEETLTALAHKHPIINEILEYRGVRKLLSTYVDPFPNLVSPKTGKIHTTFNQALTATGRLSSSKPNLQNIPIRTERGKEIRKAFIPSREDGVIMSADYSQIELRIMAHLSNDEHLVDAFRHGKDVHAITASKIFRIPPESVTPEQRRIAKTANFGIMYGISAFGLSQRLKISRAEAKKIIEDYFASFPTVSSYIDRAVASVREKGYAETLFGRRRYLPDINSRNATTRSLAERNAINAPIQGTAADIIKKAMINVDRKMKEAGMQSRMVLQVHDELVFDALLSEADDLKKLVTEEMENVIQLSIPLTVECNYGKNWLEAH